MLKIKKRKVEGLLWARIIGSIYNDYENFCKNKGVNQSAVALMTFLRDNNYLDTKKIIKDYDL